MAVAVRDSDEIVLGVSALAGDEEALGRLLTLHQRAAYNVAYRLLGRDADARDAVQEGSLLALRAVRGDTAPPRAPDSFRPWLLQVVANAALRQLRGRASPPPVSVDALAEALPAPERLDPA